MDEEAISVTSSYEPLSKKTAPSLVVVVLLLSVVAFSGRGNDDRATPHFSEDTQTENAKSTSSNPTLRRPTPFHRVWRGHREDR
jgi:hypothetical protein